jgi:predicted Zn finger-like uncharacterized protein
MYTQCPSCQTIFEVSAEHLKAANGDVRCGQCLNVFNALNHLSEDIPESKDEFLSEDAFQESGQVSVFGNQVEQSTSDEADHSGSETPIPNSEFLETDENDPELEDFFSDVIDDSAEYSQIDYETRLKKQKPLSPDGGFFYGGANESIIEKILTEQEPEERELEEFTLPLEPTPETPGAAETNAGDESEKEQSPTDIPLQLLEDLQEGKLAEEKAASNRFWLTGSIVLMMLFVTQAIYFSRHDLARNPTYRPYLTRACEMIGCTINVKYDIRLIEIIGRDVRSHPSADNALIAGTTLINNASYPQPYPLLTLTFSDITGTKLAERQFTPREYLKSGTDILAGMTPDLPVQVELELVDPGKDAVNFEFHAESDPRTTTLSRG